MNKNVKRRELTTPGPDPTVVVEWTLDLGNGHIQVAEFQGVYQGEHVFKVNPHHAHTSELNEEVAKAIHEALEVKYQEEMEEEVPW